MKPKNRTPRRRAREFAVQALYQAALNQLPDAEVAKNIRENEYFAKADNELFTAIFFGVQAKRRELMQIIRPLLDRDEKDLSPIECAVLLAAGAPGKRAALPNARVLIHQPATGGVQGQVSDLEIQAQEIERMRKLMEETLARHTGRPAEQIRLDTDRDKILTASEAVDYGIIDQVFDYRKLSAQS